MVAQKTLYIRVVTDKEMIKVLQNLIDQMSQELPGILAAAVVTVEDGMSIAEVSRREDIEPAVAAAYLASIVKSNAKGYQAAGR